MANGISEDDCKLPPDPIHPEYPTIKLVAARSDYDIAEDLKKRMIEAYKPCLELLNEADKLGFQVNVSASKGPLGFTIMLLQVSKIF